MLTEPYIRLDSWLGSTGLLTNSVSTTTNTLFSPPLSYVRQELLAMTDRQALVRFLTTELPSRATAAVLETAFGLSHTQSRRITRVRGGTAELEAYTLRFVGVCLLGSLGRITGVPARHDAFTTPTHSIGLKTGTDTSAPLLWLWWCLPACPSAPWPVVVVAGWWLPVCSQHPERRGLDPTVDTAHPQGYDDDRPF